MSVSVDVLRVVFVTLSKVHVYSLFVALISNTVGNLVSGSSLSCGSVFQ